MSAEHRHSWTIAPENSELRMRAVQEHPAHHQPCDCIPEELADMPVYVCDCGTMVAWPEEPAFEEGDQPAPGF